VRIERNGRRSRWSWASSAAVFAICMSERIPSCMRAPPVADTITSARRSFIAVSIERATFSPTTEPMLPPMKKKSMIVRLTGFSPIVAIPSRAASFMPVSFWAAASRSG